MNKKEKEKGDNQIEISTYSENNTDNNTFNYENPSEELGDANNNKNISSKIEDEDSSIMEILRIKSKKFCYKFEGRCLFLLSDNKGNPLFVIGPHWPMYFCYCGTVSIIYLLLFMFGYHKYSKWFKI
ncbi:MAG: hypothetical protein MJ252_24745, partial [archaeon]|nr:hypothetical protein [archaeon]